MFTNSFEWHLRLFDIKSRVPSTGVFILDQRCPTKLFLSPHLPILCRQSLSCCHNYEKYAVKGYLLGLSPTKQLRKKLPVASFKRPVATMWQMATGWDNAVLDQWLILCLLSYFCFFPGSNLVYV